MKIAVTYEEGQVFQHFGHTEQFKVYEVQDGKVLGSQVRSAEGSGHGALAGLLKSWGVDALLCGGIGGGARMALQEAFLAGSLHFDPNAACNHHHEGGEHHCHGEGAHTCGHHGGEHHCRHGQC